MFSLCRNKQLLQAFLITVLNLTDTDNIGAYGVHLLDLRSTAEFVIKQYMCLMLSSGLICGYLSLLFNNKISYLTQLLRLEQQL